VTRRRATTLIEALVAAVLLAAVGGLLVVAIAQATVAGQRAILGAQARRLLQQELEQVRSGRGVPSGATSGPFTVSVNPHANNAPNMLGPRWTPDCYSSSPCSNSVVTTGVSSEADVEVTITLTTGGSVMASGRTTTPP